MKKYLFLFCCFCMIFLLSGFTQNENRQTQLETDIFRNDYIYYQIRCLDLDLNEYIIKYVGSKTITKDVAEMIAPKIFKNYEQKSGHDLDLSSLIVKYFGSYKDIQNLTDNNCE